MPSEKLKVMEAACSSLTRRVGGLTGGGGGPRLTEVGDEMDLRLKPIVL